MFSLVWKLRKQSNRIEEQNSFSFPCEVSTEIKFSVHQTGCFHVYHVRLVFQVFELA